MEEIHEITMAQWPQENV